MIALAYLAVLVLAFFALVVRPQRRRLAEHRALLASLAVGERVITTAGIYGTIRAIRDDTYELEIAPGVVVELARGAIARVAPAPPLSPDDAGTDD